MNIVRKSIVVVSSKKIKDKIYVLMWFNGDFVGRLRKYGL